MTFILTLWFYRLLHHNTSSWKPWKTSMCAKTHLVMFSFEEEKGGEGLNMHASVHTSKVCDCISVLACQTDCVHEHASGLLLYLTWGGADQWGRDRASSGSRYVVLSEYSSFCSFLRNRVSMFLYCMWYLPKGSLYKTSHQDRTQTGGWCSREPIGEAVYIEADAVTNISQSVCCTLCSYAARICPFSLRFVSKCDQDL